MQDAIEAFARLLVVLYSYWGIAYLGLSFVMQLVLHYISSVCRWKHYDVMHAIRWYYDESARLEPSDDKFRAFRVFTWRIPNIIFSTLFYIILLMFSPGIMSLLRMHGYTSSYDEFTLMIPFHMAEYLSFDTLVGSILTVSLTLLGLHVIIKSIVSIYYNVRRK